MTGKEKASFRAQANGLDVLFQVGKGGINDNLIEQTDGALKTRELIKLRVLTESSPVTPRQAADELAEKTGSEVIQVIGGVIVLYRLNPELHKQEKKTAVKVKKNRTDKPKSEFKVVKKSPFVDKKGRDKRIKKKDV